MLYAAEVNHGTLDDPDTNPDTDKYGAGVGGGTKNAVLLSHYHDMEVAGAHKHDKGSMTIEGVFPGVGWDENDSTGGKGCFDNKYVFHPE